MAENLINKIKEYYYDKKIIFDWNEETVRFQKSIPEINSEDATFVDYVGNLLELVSSKAHGKSDVNDSFQKLVIDNLGMEFLDELVNEYELSVSVSNNVIIETRTEVLTKRSGLHPERIIKVSGGLHLSYKTINGKQDIISFEVDEDSIELLMNSLINLSERISTVKDLEKE